MGTHLRVLNESYPMNTNMTGLRCFSKIYALGESSLSIERVKLMDTSVVLAVHSLREDRSNGRGVKIKIAYFNENCSSEFCLQLSLEYFLNLCSF